MVPIRNVCEEQSLKCLFMCDYDLFVNCWGIYKIRNLLGVSVCRLKLITNKLILALVVVGALFPTSVGGYHADVKSVLLYAIFNLILFYF